MVTIAGLVFAGAALVVMLFQFALALGVPWGHLAMGGRYPGRMPVAMRVSAWAQGGIMAAMGWTVAAHAGVIAEQPPGWTLWVVAGITLMTFVLNLITPSRAERRLWGPVTFVMLCCVLVVLGGQIA